MKKWPKYIHIYLNIILDLFSSDNIISDLFSSDSQPRSAVGRAPDS